MSSGRYYNPFSLLPLALCLLFVQPGHAQPEEPQGLFLTWQQDPTTTMTVEWHVDSESVSDRTIRYKLIGTEEWKEQSAEELEFPHSDRSILRVELTGLERGSEYRFRVGEFERAYQFRTMPGRLTEPLRFATGGDVRHEYEMMVNTNRIAMQYDPDFIVWGGDLSYANGDPARVDHWHDWFQAIMETLISEDGRVVPILLTIGNHEQFFESRVRGGTYPHEEAFTEEETQAYMQKYDLYDGKATFFYDLFAFPGRPGYNVLDFGNYLSLIVLDTDHDSPVEGEQTDWLQNVLAERDGRAHLFPVYHVPAYPSARPYNNTTATRIRTSWVPLFEEHGVRVAFENHDHRYKRTPPIRNGEIVDDGIVYIGDGGWGVDVESDGDNSDEWFIDKFERYRHAIIVTLHGPHQHYLVVSEDGEIIDEYPQTPQVTPERPETVQDVMK